MKSVFTSNQGVAEIFVALEGLRHNDFREETEALLQKLDDELDGAKPVWIKFHVSDVVNQKSVIDDVMSGGKCLYSVIGQAPTNGSRVSLEAYALSDGDISYAGADEATVIVNLKNYRLMYFHTPKLEGKGSYDQMAEEFAVADRKLTAAGGTLEANMQRTWIYCRDIDNNYAGLVVARREHFARNGLTADTHFIASTGIEGKSDPFDRLVRMDSVALFGHRREQVTYMSALDHLNPTHEYGVTFERATRLTFGDRSKYYVSGTASIDKNGQIVHPGDVGRQAERMLENINALLSNYDAALKGLKLAVVYLRDPADAAIVEDVLSKCLPVDLPRIMVHGAVCRPGWLVEMEGVAVKGNGDASFAPFV
ncbi:MAG: hypothetical protein IKZ46_13955 [Victivallales bacterium]|nr:hypothetical protein [Victivallales bacterium]